MELSPLELWLLARTAGGYDIPSTLPDGIDPEVAALIQAACRLEYRDREYLVKKSAPERIWKQIQAVNTESPMPSADDGVEPPAFAIIAADDLDKLPPLQWLIPGEIVENGICVLFGESGVGKSFIALDYAMRLASNGVKVLYAPTEGEAGYHKRVSAWKSFHKLKRVPALYFIFGGLMLHDKEAMAQIMPHIKKVQPRLVVIDTLAMGMAGLDENSARDVNMFMMTCRKFSRLVNTAVLLVHHTSKAGVMERGSTALRGNADTMIRISDADEAVMVECSKTKDEEKFQPRYLTLIKHEDSLIPIPADRVLMDVNALTPNQRKLLELLAMETNRDGITVRDAGDMTGLSVGTVVRSLSNLLQKKLVEKNGSYRINDAGLKAIGRSDSSDSHADSLQNGQVSPRDSMIHLNHRAGENSDNESSRESMNQADQMNQVNQANQQTAFVPPLTEVKKRKSQYAHGS